MRHKNKGQVIHHQLLVGIDLYQLKRVHIWTPNHPADCFICCHSNLSLSVFISCLHRLNLTYSRAYAYNFFVAAFLLFSIFFFPVRAILFPFNNCFGNIPNHFHLCWSITIEVNTQLHTPSIYQVLSSSYLGYVNSLCICLILNNTCDQMPKHQSRLQPNDILCL